MTYAMMTNPSPSSPRSNGVVDGNIMKRRKRTQDASLVLVGVLATLMSVPSTSVVEASRPRMAFSAPLYSATGAGAALRTSTPSLAIPQENVAIEMPNFDELFDRIQQVSPLAKMALDGVQGGFQVMDATIDAHKWKVLDSNKRKTVHHIDKIDNFQDLGCPIFRFRSSLNGPCIPELFANFITTLEQREKWDPQIAQVDNLYPIDDLDAATAAIGSDYGSCSRLGVGYCATKPNFVVDSREQLTLCGIQDFDDGSSVIWGTELDDKHNHLFPEGERHTRARSHLFSTTLMPTGPDTFDVEYILQMDIGGKIPPFLTSPVMVETVKSMFTYANSFFKGGEGSDLARFITDMVEKHGLFTEKRSLLLTP